MEHTLDEQIICKDYIESGLGIESLASKYHVGKLKIKKVLTDNGIELKKRGGQVLCVKNVVADPKEDKYTTNHGEMYLVIDRENGFELSTDIKNEASFVNYIKDSYNIEVPTVYNRKKYYQQTGNYWWERWLDVYQVNGSGAKILLTDVSKNKHVLVGRIKKEKYEIYGKSTKKLTWDEVLRRMKEAHPGENIEYPVQELTNGVHTRIRIIDHDLKDDGTEYGEYVMEVRAHIQGGGAQGKRKRKAVNKLSWDEVVDRMREAHPDENLEYPKQELTDGVHTKIRIIDHDLRADGTEYGEYTQEVLLHINGSGHKEKGLERSRSSRKISWETYVDRMRKAHPGEKLEYPKQELTNGIHTVIRIIDHDLDEDGDEYGEYWQEINSHLRGAGHERKANKKRSDSNIKLDRDILIKKFKDIFGDAYTYDKFVYNGYHEKSIVTCKEHGDFLMEPSNLLQGHGCQKCSNVYHYTLEEWKEKASQIHNNKYDYSLVTEYNNAHEKLKVICPEHGVFEISSNKHLAGQGCYECGREKILEATRMTVDEFIEKATARHNGKYTYVPEEIHYKNNHTIIPIHCPVHGVFKQTPNSHLMGSGCPKCACTHSKAEEEVFEFVRSLGFDPIQHDRKILGGLELDIYIPEKRIAIEYNGLHWHSEEQGKGRLYHVDKLNRCNKSGVKLIQIFEDEYVHHKEIVEGKIKHILGCDTGSVKIGARKCVVMPISKEEAKVFLDKYHIQGFGPSTVYLGAFVQNKRDVLGVMSFKIDPSGDNHWELTRFASNWDYSVPGLGGKMFAWFVRNYNPVEVKSFADRRWTLDKDDNLYTKIGFILDKVEKPDYRYIVGDERKHKFLFRKQILAKKFDLPLVLTESEMCQILGFERIWDCGLIKYVWRKQNI